MQSTRRTKIMLRKQRRTRLMLEHIIAQLPSRYSKVEQWLQSPRNREVHQFQEWGEKSQWIPKLLWMQSHLSSKWDEVERLMSNHPFSCVIDSTERNNILSANPVYSKQPTVWKQFDLAELA